MKHVWNVRVYPIASFHEQLDLPLLQRQSGVDHEVRALAETLCGFGGARVEVDTGHFCRLQWRGAVYPTCLFRS